MYKTQSKLDNFFKVKVSPDTTSKKCFIYDPANCNAYFANAPEEDCTFVTCREKIKLYIRKTVDVSALPNVYCLKTQSIPLLKSNLQKAIRRFQTNIAISTTILLLQLDPVELIRRLPIIYIEDVCLIDSLPIMTWFLMADKDYKITNLDKWYIVSFVKNLCEVKQFYPNEEKVPNDFTHEQLCQYPNYDCLLAIFYRTFYGGMAGDMNMLETSIQYYIDNPSKVIPKTIYNFADFHIEPEVIILDEAIDFHPFPKMLTYIMINILKDYDVSDDITGETVKKYIWLCESGINFRKEKTIKTQKELTKDELWPIIQEYLPQARNKMLEPN